MSAFQPEDGGALVFSERVGYRPLQIPCGQCIGCRVRRQEEWVVRALCEAKTHEDNCVVTLTYHDDNLPQYGSLCYPHFQRFVKRARKVWPPFRYLVAGEYGSQRDRPHFHALLFGVRPADGVIHARANDGSWLWRSATLERLWPFGFSTFGDLSPASAAYVARYVVKRVTGDAAEEHYQRVTDCGELVQLEPEFGRMSLKPAIGRRFFERYSQEVTVRDAVVVQGVRRRVPRYFDRLLEMSDSELKEEIDIERFRKGKAAEVDSSPDRLAVQELVLKAKLAVKQERL